MSHQDWNTVTFKKKTNNVQQEAQTQAKKTAVNVGHNNKQTIGVKQPTRILKDDEGEEYVAKKTKTYDAQFRKRMQEAHGRQVSRAGDLVS